MSLSVLPMFSSKRFIVFGFTFRSLIHFEFIFVYGIRKCSNFIFLHVAVQFSQHHLLKGLSFYLAYSFLCCAKALKFNQVPLVYFCIYFHYSRRWVIEDFALIYVIECSASKNFIVSSLIFRS